MNDCAVRPVAKGIVPQRGVADRSSVVAKQKTEMHNAGIIRLVMLRMDQKKEFSGTDIPLQVKNEFCTDYKKYKTVV